jgi:uncharacterized protein YbaP (TraB family)
VQLALFREDFASNCLDRMNLPQSGRWLPLALSVATALFALGAAPATPPVQDWSNTEIVVVRPDHPGPALWHIVKDKSEVWILPTVSPVPKGMPWDTHEIESLLKGANALLLPPRASVGVFEGLWFWMTSMDMLEQPSGTELENTLPAPLKARFVAARTRMGRDADRYADFLGGVAALRLESDYWSFANFTPNGPQRTIESLASRAGVSAKPTATYPAMNVIKDVPKMTAAAHLACLGMALDDIDTQSAHAIAAADAWAKGDIAGVKAHYSETKLDDCLNQNSAYRVLRESANRDMTNAIVAALNKPGTTVVVMPMGFFLRKGGVLERLEAAGLTVTGPGS